MLIPIPLACAIAAFPVAVMRTSNPPETLPTKPLNESILAPRVTPVAVNAPEIDWSPLTRISPCAPLETVRPPVPAIVSAPDCPLIELTSASELVIRVCNAPLTLFTNPLSELMRPCNVAPVAVRLPDRLIPLLSAAVQACCPVVAMRLLAQPERELICPSIMTPD